MRKLIIIAVMLLAFCSSAEAAGLGVGLFWGGITGDINDQNDLMLLLDAAGTGSSLDLNAVPDGNVLFNDGNTLGNGPRKSKVMTSTGEAGTTQYVDPCLPDANGFIKTVDGNRIADNNVVTTSDTTSAYWVLCRNPDNNGWTPRHLVAGPNTVITFADVTEPNITVTAGGGSGASAVTITGFPLTINGQELGWDYNSVHFKADSDGYFDINFSPVNDTNDQNIAGVKTFTSSPIVPTPTTDYQASTKKYVDDQVATASSAAIIYQAVGANDVAISSADVISSMPDMLLTETTIGTSILAYFTAPLIDESDVNGQSSIQFLKTGLTPGSHTVQIKWLYHNPGAPNNYSRVYLYIDGDISYNEYLSGIGAGPLYQRGSTDSPRVLTIYDLP